MPKTTPVLSGKIMTMMERISSLTNLISKNVEINYTYPIKVLNCYVRNEHAKRGEKAVLLLCLLIFDPPKLYVGSYYNKFPRLIFARTDPITTELLKFVSPQITTSQAIC